MKQGTLRDERSVRRIRFHVIYYKLGLVTVDLERRNRLWSDVELRVNETLKKTGCGKQKNDKHDYLPFMERAVGNE